MIISVDKNRSEVLDFPQAARGAEALEGALGNLGFTQVRRLAGQEVNQDAIDRAIRDLGAGLTGTGHILFVAWIGHGFVPGGENAEQRLLTYNSGLSGDAQVFTNTLSAAKLTEMLRLHKREGTELGFVLEACRTPIAGAPSKPPEILEPVAEVECRTATGVMPALVPEELGMPLFTHHFCAALKAASAQRVSLLDSLRIAVARTQQYSDQAPEIVSGERDICLLDRGSLSMTIQPLRAHDGQPLPSATIELPGLEGQREPITGATTYAGLRDGATYELVIESAGYYPYRDFIDVHGGVSGQTYEVPLAARYVEIEGRIEHLPEERIEVTVTGDFGGRTLRDYHQLRGEVDPDGRFLLRVPASDRPHALLVRAEREVLRTLPLDLAEGLRSSGPLRMRLDDWRTPRLEESLVPSVELSVLLDRAAYAELDRSSVEGLVGLAQSKWRGELTGFEYARVERFECGGSSHWMSVWKHGETGLEFVLVPGGKFQMGSPAGETDRDFDEKPHWVTLDPFLMARTECTQAAWAGVARRAGLNSDPSHFEGSSALPVETVSWEDVDEWCRAAKLKLPTEAQWEFACRAGTTTAFSMGNRLSSSEARFGLDWNAGPQPVGGFKANAFGLLDVHGNVSEWCRDWYVDYDQPVPERNGLRKGTSSRRVRRGGSCYDPARRLRSAYRAGLGPVFSSWYLGFRPSQDLPF